MIKIGTEKLKMEVAKAFKCCTKESMMPLTTMMGIKVVKNKLHLCTTDKTNDVEVIIDKVESEDVSITVNAEQFSKLISKMTSDSIELEITESNLLVKGNGDYKIPLVVDEEGLVEFPSIKFNKVGLKTSEVLLSTIKSIYAHNRASLAKTFEQPELVGYYIGSKIITTDGEVACFNEVEFADKHLPVLVNPAMMDLLVTMKEEKIKFVKKGNQLYFYTPTMIICGSEADGLADYPVEAIEAFLTQDFKSSCKVSKGLLLAALDRLQLFVTPYDQNGCRIVFTEEGLQVSSFKNSSIEVINYTESKEFEAHTCELNVPMLKEQVSAIQEDLIEIHYGSDVGIKLVAGKVTIVVSQLEGEEEYEES